MTLLLMPRRRALEQRAVRATPRPNAAHSAFAVTSSCFQKDERADLDVGAERCEAASCDAPSPAGGRGAKGLEGEAIKEQNGSWPFRFRFSNARNHPPLPELGTTTTHGSVLWICFLGEELLNLFLY